MPNWCTNWLSVYGDGALLDQIEAQIEGEEEHIDFNKIVPQPDPIEDWYTWRLENWGTKWNADASHLAVDVHSITYEFSTAWSPPVPVAQKLSEMFPSVLVALAYDEPGVDFGGYVIFQNGDVLDEGDGGSKMASWEEIMNWNVENVQSTHNQQTAVVEDLPLDAETP